VADILRGFPGVEDLLDPWLRYRIQNERYERTTGFRLWKSGAQNVLILSSRTALIPTTMMP
jgi:hypothetical protein